MTQVKSLSAKLEGELKKSDLPGTAKSARVFLDDSNESLKKISQLRLNLENSIQNFDQVMNSAKNLLDYLEQHPASLISGKEGKPVVEPK